MRNASHFRAPPIDDTTADWPTTADAALTHLDAEYATWMGGISTVDDPGAPVHRNGSMAPEPETSPPVLDTNLRSL